MEQSQLVELIRMLKPEETVQIRHFAAIPFFNNGRMRAQVIPLLDVFLSHSWENNEQRLEKKQVFEIIFPNQPFVEGKLEKVMVEANKVARSFLLAQRYFREENEFHQVLDFSEIVRSLGLHNRFQQMMSRLQKIQDESPHHNSQHFHRQFLLEFIKYDEESIRNQAKGDLNIPQAILALELEYYLNRLVLLNQILIQKKIAHLDVPEIINRLIEENHIPAGYLKESPCIKINQEIFNLLKKDHPTSSEVKSLFDLLLFYEKSLDSRSLREFYTYLRNLCVLSLTADYEQVEMEYMLHELYKDNLYRGYLHFEGKISRSRYLAVTNNALSLGEFDWALTFIEKYKFELRDENETQDIYRLNLANYLFRVGRFSEALDNVPTITPFIDYLMIAKRLELKSLYELQSELLPYKLDAFKMFLSRTSQKLLSESKRQSHSDFANLLHQLVHSLPGDAKRSDILVKRILEKKQSAEWRWLLEKAKALKTR